MSLVDFGHLEKLWARVHNITRRVSLVVCDDTGVYQVHQIQGYPGELRDAVPRVQEFGVSTVPPVGAEGVTVSANGGYHGTQTIISTNHPQYRPKNQNPGEVTVYIVDGADAKGNGGTVRACLIGQLGWITSLLGKTIDVGDTNAETINVGTTASSVTINMGSSSATVNITGGSGDVTVNGVSLVHHVHSGVQPGDGDTGQPVS